MQGLVTVFGGSGFVGRQIVRSLAKAGWRLRVAVRHPHLAQDLRLAGDVGQIQLIQANIRNEASVRRALDGAQACVNAVGCAVEQGRQTFGNIHVAGAGELARIAHALGVIRFVQLSGIGATPKAGSKYARARAEGEAAVRAAFPDADILRPSIVFGPGDHVLTTFAKMAAISPVLPVVGGAMRLQPVYVGDVARAVKAVLAGDGPHGRTYELAGPAQITMRDLMARVCAEIQRRPLLLPLPFAAAGLIGLAGDAAAFLGLTPPLTSDQVELLKTDNLPAPGSLGLAELGIAPTALDAVIGDYLQRYRPGGQYAGELKRASLPAA